MELRTLTYFLAVAERESFSAAANEVLFVTQPTLSRQMKELEEELGAKLFERGSRKTTLTEAGMRFRERAREIVELARQTEKEFAEQGGDEVVGDVYVGGGETKAFAIVAAACRRLREKHPRIRLHLTSGNAQDVTEKLDRGLLDFALLVEPADKSKYEYVELPARDTWGLLVRKDHPLAKKGFVTVGDLEKTPLLVSRQTMMMREFSGSLGRDLASLNVVATYNLIYNAAVFVEQGLGAAFSLEGLVNTSGRSRLAFVPFTPIRTSGLVVVWKRNPVFSRPAARFLECLRSEIGKRQAPSARRRAT
ncbi:MAG: LysR family transcriptional regulator [Fibrobacterales bacterium]|nr:LysR family transcriptional regulator [Fibrobacterales bacterium]